MRLGYKDAVKWLAYNDDCTWLDDQYGSFSVSLALVADIYQGGNTDKVERDLRKFRKEMEE